MDYLEGYNYGAERLGNRYYWGRKDIEQTDTKAKISIYREALRVFGLSYLNDFQKGYIDALLDSIN